MKKKVLSLLLSLSILLAMCPITAWAAKFEFINKVDTISQNNISKIINKSTQIYDGSIATNFAGGDGSESNPYQIATASQLAKLANDSTNNYYYILVDDIYLNSTETDNWYSSETVVPWESIKNFSGSFDGQGYTIHGLYRGSLFGNATGEIKNIRVKDSYVSTGHESYVGTIAGYAKSISGCSSDGKVSAKSTSNSTIYAGGIAGYADIVTQCVNSGFVRAYDVSSSGYGASAGGIVGCSGTEISNCYNTGDVSSQSNFASHGYSYSGGIVGSTSYNNTKISYCYDIGMYVWSSDYYCGGIVGLTYNRSIPTLTNCYCAVSRLVGKPSNSKLCGKYTEDSCAASKEEIMKQEETFGGFDFATVWSISSDLNDGYPTLQWESRTSPGAVTANGTCGSNGDNLTWALKDGVLTIRGLGGMKDYTMTAATEYIMGTDAPWFTYADSIKSVVIENGVSDIGNFAFAFCKELTDVSISNGVSSIGLYAFSECSSLPSISIPNTVSTIETNAFNGCSKLNDVILPNNIEVIMPAVFANCNSLSTITIPNSVKSIDSSAFADCGLINISIPKNVTGIDYCAFENCNGLTMISIPNSVTSIGAMAFSGCTSLTDVYYSGNENGWKEIKIGDENDPLTSAKIHYNSTGPDEPVSPGTSYYIYAMDFGSHVINKAGRAVAYFCVKNKDGEPLSGVRLQYRLNGIDGVTHVVSDDNGLVGVITPHTERDATFCAVFSANDGIDVHNNTQSFEVKVTDLSYTQEWEGVFNLGGELEINLGGAGVTLGPAELDASIASIAAAGDIGNSVSIQDDYNNGKRTLTLNCGNEIGGGLELSSGFEAQLTDAAKISPLSGSAKGRISNQLQNGITIENYDPTNKDHLVQLGSMVVAAPILQSRSVLVEKLLESMDLDICDIEASESSVSLDSSLNGFKVEIGDFEGSLSGLGGTTVWAFNDSYDHTINNVFKTSKSYKAAVHTGIGSNMSWEPEIPENVPLPGANFGQYIFGLNRSNSKEISAERKINSADFDSISYKVYNGDEQNYLWAGTTTDVYSTVTFGGDDAKALLNNNPEINQWANGRNPFINIQNTIDTMVSSGQTAHVQETNKVKEITEFSLPLGLGATVGVGLEGKLNFGISGDHSISWNNASGILYKKTFYPTSVSDVKAENVKSSAKGLEDLISEAAKTVLPDLLKNVESHFGKTIDGVKNEMLELHKISSDWYAVISTIRPNIRSRGANTESHTVVGSMSEEDSVADTTFNTLGESYEIDIYTDESMKTAVSDKELTENPLTISLRYTDEMLKSANAPSDADVILLRFDNKKNAYICEPSGVQDKVNMTITASMTKNGEYILAVKPTTCTVSFDANGGYGTMQIATVKIGDSYTLPDCTFTPPSNKTFSSWAIGSTDGTKAAANSTYTFTTDTTVYALWTNKSNPVVPDDNKPSTSGPSSGSTSNSGSSGGGGASYSNGSSVSVSKSENGSVSISPSKPKKGETVIITVTPKDGYELGVLTVSDSSGKAIDTTEGSDGKYTFTMPTGKVTITPVFMQTNDKPDNDSAQQPSIHFTDVPSDAYYSDAVAWAIAHGITNGTTETTFSPDNSCTRAQMVTFLWRTAGSPAPANKANPFRDVTAGTYYYDAVLWAVEHGITTGTTDVTFSPNNTVTRGQTVTFLHRDAGSPKMDTISPFEDVPSNAYYADAVTWAASNNITKGTTDTMFSPNESCTRGQIVTFLYRYKNK